MNIFCVQALGGSLDASLVVTLIYATCVSWIAGFVIIGLPGGLGVREAVFISLMTAPLGAGLAVSVAVISRVVSVAVDLLGAAISVPVSRTAPPLAAPPRPTLAPPPPTPPIAPSTDPFVDPRTVAARPTAPTVTLRRDVDTGQADHPDPVLQRGGDPAAHRCRSPREVPGVDIVEWLVIDDGSSDRTVEVARSLGVDHIISHPHNRGLAAAFMTGLDACLRAGADVIVNTDADNQYQGASIPDLVAPVLSGQAEMVVGERPIETIDDFSRTKKLLQRFGSSVVRRFSGTGVRDAASGFRAYSRDAAMRVQVFGRYTYTMETIVQAGLERHGDHLGPDRGQPEDP